ncbi:MAG: penicillin-binding protein [Chitinophagaceae bacterium]
MDIKNEILSRAYLTFFAVIGISLFIIGKAAFIQQSQGKYWRSLNEALHQKTDTIIAERGTIFSEDGKMLSTSIPEFDIYIDFAAQGLRAKKGEKFYKNVDSLCIELNGLFGDYTAQEYRKILVNEYKKKTRYFQFKKHINYTQFKQLNTFHLVKLGRNTSGFIVEVKSRRLNPYGNLAFRTIGLARDSFKVGLELSYDSLLKGISGTRTVRYIAGGVAVPVEDAIETETQNGKDIVTTIDVLTQEITENALHNMLFKNQSQYGCAVVMETKTGKIKAIANLGLDSAALTKSFNEKSEYREIKNYALYATEPGSTFKLATMIALLDDGKIKTTTPVDLQGGLWQFAQNATVTDAEVHGRGIVSAQEAFELSSNVGMAKMIWNNYANNPSAYINKLHSLRLDTVSGIDLVGERKPIFHKPGTRGWERTTLPWMAHGYNVSVTPLQTLTLYNAVANNGKMMKPYLASAIMNEGVTIKEFQPTVINEKICNDSALAAVKKCMIGVCHSSLGTAKKLFINNPYLVAGKTGTSFVVDNKIKYSDRIYQSSFAGFFPADNPQYTCVVIIVNKASSPQHFGAEVAGPVFKEIADRLYTTYVKNSNINKSIVYKKDSSSIAYSGYKEDAKYILNMLNAKYLDNSDLANDWIKTNTNSKNIQFNSIATQKQIMPSLKGMNLKDAVFMCEEIGLKVVAKGKGKVNQQSIGEGSKISFGQVINIGLN